jgi:hypothetical protein
MINNQEYCYVVHLKRFLSYPSQPEVKVPSLTKKLKEESRSKESKEKGITIKGMFMM